MKKRIRSRFAFALVVTLILSAVPRLREPRILDYFALQSTFAADGPAAAILPGLADALATPVLVADCTRLAAEILQEGEGLARDRSLETGGLWLSGDVTDALERVLWIVGPANAELVRLGGDGEVKLDAGRLVRAARIEGSVCGEAPTLLAAYISDNEGLLLLLQITRSLHRYLLHIGRRAPTGAGDVIVNSCLNLDNKFDSRVNPRRRNGMKLMTEQPPRGLDSVVAINPSTQWLNLMTNRMVPPGIITFHELAEAHARVEFGFDYLGQGSCPGAHDTELEREAKLFSQRPLSDTVITRGDNRIVLTEDRGAASQVHVKRR